MNRFLVGTVGVACALLASTAIAGWTQAYPVVVDQQAMAAYGSLGSTRSSGGAFDELGCRVWAFPGAPLQGMCFASDEKGNSVSCMLVTDEMMRAMSFLTSDSYVSFSYNEAGKCETLLIEQSSAHEPKKP